MCESSWGIVKLRQWYYESINSKFHCEAHEYVVFEGLSWNIESEYMIKTSYAFVTSVSVWNYIQHQKLCFIPDCKIENLICKSET